MRTALRFTIICLACTVVPLADAGHCSPAGDDQPRLTKIVALSRHGVRSPTQSAATLSQWSTRTWPQWPVPRGYLTPRGAKLVTAMWEDMRGRMQNLGLLPDAACPPPGRVFVRADVDQRTKATAKAVLDGLCSDGSQSYAVRARRPTRFFTRCRPGCSVLTQPLWPPVLLIMPGATWTDCTKTTPQPSRTCST